MIWRAGYGDARHFAQTREAAQAFVDHCLFALVTNLETGERWIRRPEGWRETVPARPRRTPLREPSPTWPAPKPRADHDG